MSADPKLDEIIAPLIEAIQRAMEQVKATSFAAGRDAALAAVMSSVQQITPAASVAAEPTPPPSDNGEQQEPARRAPRGLVDVVLEDVLKASPGMTQSEVEDAVVAVDDRISRKTVYNTLRRYENSGRKFRRDKRQLWYRVGDLPPPWADLAGSPKGETGGDEPPVSENKLV